MGIEENKALIRKLYHEGYTGDPEKLDVYFAPDYVDHCLWKTLDGLKRVIAELQSVYTDAKWTIEKLVCEGDHVAVAATVRSQRYATKVRVRATSIYRLAHGKIVEHWGHTDSAA